MQVSGERLPWLSDESPAATRPAEGARASRPARALWPLYILLILIIGGVAFGAWWLGTAQRDAAAPQLPAEQAAPLPPSRPVDDAVPEAVPPPTDAPIQIAEPPVIERARARVIEQRRAASSSGTADTGSSVTQVARPVFPADEPAIAPPPTGPSPIIVYHPQPNRGRVVQLGAFPTRAQAEAGWRSLTRRYPYLATKPKMVNTVDVRGLGGGRPTRMYRLQLGTSSQAQSAVICQQLEKAGQSCVVVY